MNADSLRMLWQATLALSAALAVVLLLRATLRRHVGAQAAYTLWLLPPVSLLAGLLPAPTVEVPAMALQLQAIAGATTAALATTSAATSFDPTPWLLLAWLAGACACAWLLWRQQRRFVRGLGCVRPLARGLWRAERGEGCPAVIGVLPPRLVLPPDFESRYDAAECALILAHEHAHLARGDAFANALAALLRGAFWFHPLVHYAIARFRQDQELACDAAVLRRHPQSRRAYADAMLKTQLAVLGLPVGCHWQSSHPLKERIAMLKNPLPNLVRRALGFSFAATLVLAGGYTAWAVQPAQAKAAPADSDAHARKILAAFELRVDGGEASRFTVVNPLGEPFSFRNDDGAAWEGDFTVSDSGAGQWRLAGTLKRDGNIVSQPTLVLQEGKQGGIKIDPDNGGHGRLDLEVTLTSLSDEEAKKMQSAAASAPKSAAAVEDHAAREIKGVRQGKPPQYPAVAIKQRISGKVVLRVLVDEGGIPKQVEVHSAKAFAASKADDASAKAAQGEATDPALLVDAAKAVIWDWHFEPALRDGKAVQDWLDVPFTFAIR